MLGALYKYLYQLLRQSSSLDTHLHYFPASVPPVCDTLYTQTHVATWISHNHQPSLSRDVDTSITRCQSVWSKVLYVEGIGWLIVSVRIALTSLDKTQLLFFNTYNSTLTWFFTNKNKPYSSVSMTLIIY